MRKKDELSRSKVESFLSATPETQEAMRACAALDRGKAGTEQASSVRGLLNVLEARGLAVYRGEGWFLTDTGKAAAKTYLAVGRAARRTSEARCSAVGSSVGLGGAGALRHPRGCSQHRRLSAREEG